MALYIDLPRLATRCILVLSLIARDFCCTKKPPFRPSLLPQRVLPSHSSLLCLQSVVAQLDNEICAKKIMVFTDISHWRLSETSRLSLGPAKQYSHAELS